jgi:hypothetical protein
MSGWLYGEYEEDSIYDELRPDNNIFFISYELTGMYALHSGWVLEGVFETPESAREGKAVFNHWRNLLSKFGIISHDSKPWLYSQKFISFQGGLYYDYGYLYFLVIFLLLVLGKVGLKYKWCSIIGLHLYSAVFIVLLMSPMIIMTDIMMFPVYIFCGLLYALSFKVFTSFRIKS